MLKITFLLLLLVKKSMSQTCLNETKWCNENILENVLNKELINPYEIKELRNNEEYITLVAPFIIANR